MEQQNKILKLLFLIAFLALAGVSCWATAESLHMLLDTWPIVFCWVVTIAFFIIASLGTKLIADSLNQNVYIEKRTAKLIAGIVITFIFWLICSMPTNTHTFFYKLKIGDIVTQDISVTKGYLSQLANRKVTDSAFDDIETQVDKLSLKMNNEFNGLGRSGKKGNGQYVMGYMREINSILDSDIPIDRRANVYNTSILNEYNSKITSALENVKRTKYQTQDDEQASLMHEDLVAMDSAIKNMVDIGAIDEDLIKQTEGVLQRAYALIASNKKFVNFNGNTDDEKIYTAENLVTRTKRLRSVFDVWVDFINGRYQDSVLFAFWIVISILVDVAAFIFFDLVFKKEEY